jgi:pilus assembly protein CpaF
MKDGSRRITHVTEVAGMEGDIITMQDLFVLDHGTPDDGGFGAMNGHPDIAATPSVPTLVATGLRPAFLPQLMRSGVNLDLAVFTPPAGSQVVGRGGRRW